MVLSTLIVMSIAWQPLPSDVTVDVRIEPSVIPYHKLAEYRVVLEVPPGTTYRMPSMMGRFDGLVSRGGVETQEEVLESGRVRAVETYRLEAVFPGLYAPEAAKIEVDGVAYTIPSPVLRVRELTESERLLAEQFDPGMPGYDPDSSRALFNRRMLWIAIAVALAAVIAAVYILRQRARHMDARARPPWELALARLDALEARDLPAKGEYDRYYVDLSAILRYYVEARFNIHAPERTTPEFLEEIAEAERFDPAQEAFLASFLRHCDRVKFARLEPEPADMNAHMAAVRRFVEETVPQEQPADESEPEAA